MSKPRGTALRWSASEIDALAQRDAEDVRPALDAWEKHAPALYRYLLHAELPLPRERLDAAAT